MFPVRSFEGEPDRQRQEVAERQGGFVELPPQHFAHVSGQCGLIVFDALEGLVELCAGLVVIVGEAVAHGFERMQRNTRVRSYRANGRTTNPHPTGVARSARVGSAASPFLKLRAARVSLERLKAAGPRRSDSSALTLCVEVG